MQELVQMDEIAKDIRQGKPVREVTDLEPLTKIQREWMEKRLNRADFSEAVRLNYYVGSALGSREREINISKTASVRSLNRSWYQP